MRQEDVIEFRKILIKIILFVYNEYKVVLLHINSID